MRTRNTVLRLWVVVMLLGSACADRFGSIGEYEDWEGLTSPSTGSQRTAVDPTTDGYCDSTVVGSGTNACQSASGDEGTMTCISNGCWTSCEAVASSGGAPSTTRIGATECNGATSGGVFASTQIGNAHCGVNDCRAYCILVNGSGGVQGTTVVGNTSCGAQGPTGRDLTTTVVPYGVQSGGATGTIVED